MHHNLQPIDTLLNEVMTVQMNKPTFVIDIFHLEYSPVKRIFGLDQKPSGHKPSHAHKETVQGTLTTYLSLPLPFFRFTSVPLERRIFTSLKETNLNVTRHVVLMGRNPQ